MEKKKVGKLPRLAKEFYRGKSYIHWVHTTLDRQTGWLCPEFHFQFREILLHTLIRHQLLCPIYTIMPDHIHLIWIGLDAESCQLNANKFFRRMINSKLAPQKLQPQAYDHVLRKEEREKNALLKTITYISENPVRKNLVKKAKEYPFTDSMVPGYPNLNPLEDGYWNHFWKIYDLILTKRKS